MSTRRLALDDGSLVDVLDRLLDTGAYVDGTVLLTLADVDLVRLDLRLLLASIETLRADPADQSPREDIDEPTPTASTELPRPAEPLASKAVRLPAARNHEYPSNGHRPATQAAPAPALPVHTAAALSADEADMEDRHAGIAGLVVALVDIVRQLLERQAVRRMDAGALTDTQVERLGRALMALERQTAELGDYLAGHRDTRSAFGPGLWDAPARQSTR